MGSSIARAMWVLLALVAVLSLAAGCSKREAAPSTHDFPPPAKGDSAAASASNTGAVPRDPAHVTTVNVSVSVASVDDAARRLREETARAEGYVSNMSGHGEGKHRRASFELRVPAARLPSFRAAVASLGEIESEEERVEEVGEERADRKARLANARAEEKRILELLSNRTGSLGDVLAAERELARVRESVERFEGQDAALEGKIAFATIRVNLAPRAEVFVDRPFARIGAAAKDGVRYANIVIVGCAVALFEVGPTLLSMVLFGMMVWMGIRSARRLHARRLAARMASMGA